MQIEEHNAICFDRGCVKSGKQLFNSNHESSDVHYRLNHALQAINKASPIFRSFRSDQDIGLSKQYLRQMETKIDQNQNHFLSIVTELLNNFLLNEKKQISRIQHFIGQDLKFQSLQPQLKKNTDLTNLTLQILNHQYKGQGSNVRQYLERLPKLTLFKSQQFSRNIIKSIITSFFETEIDEIKEEPIDAELNLQRILQELPEEIRERYQRFMNTRSDLKASEWKIRCVKSRNSTPKDSRDEELEKKLQTQIVENFQKKEKKLNYTHLKEEFRSQVEEEQYRKAQRKVFKSVFDGIQNQMKENSLSCQVQISYNHSSFKRCMHQMMNSEQTADAVKLCLRKYSSLSPQIQVPVFQIFALYISIVQKLKSQAKDTKSHSKEKQGKDKVDEITIYLYFLYRDRRKVCKTLNQFYGQDYTLQQVEKQWKLTLIALVDKIAATQNDSIFTSYYNSFRKQLKKEHDLQSRRWEKVVYSLAEYGIYKERYQFYKLYKQIKNLVQNNKSNNQSQSDHQISQEKDCSLFDSG